MCAQVMSDSVATSWTAWLLCAWVSQARLLEWVAIYFSSMYTHTHTHNFAVNQKVTQHCKSTILKKKKSRWDWSLLGVWREELVPCPF